MEIIEAVPPALLNGISVVAVVLLVGWLVWTGRLVTRREADDIRHDRDEWRAEARLRDQTVADLMEQNSILLRDIGPAITSFMSALQNAGEEKRR